MNFQTTPESDGDLSALATRPPVRLRVLLADDSPTFLAAARRLLEASGGTEFVGSASSGREALGMVEALRPDLVLMDLHMPEMGGLEATRRLAARDDSPLVVIVSIQDAEEYRTAALGAGASGFVTKAELGDRWIEVLRDIVPRADMPQSADPSQPPSPLITAAPGPPSRRGDDRRPRPVTPRRR